MSSFIIKSQTKNRIRIKSKYFKKNTIKNIEDSLKTFNVLVRVNLSCNSIIILFNPKKNNIEEILTTIDNISSAFIPLKDKEEIKQDNCCIYQNELRKFSLKRQLIEFGVLSGFAIYFFIKKNILSIAVVTTPFSLIAIVSIISAFPLLKSAFKDTKEKRFSLQTFMSFSLVLAIIFGEATAAFEIIYILRGSMLFEEYTAEKSRMEIHKLIETGEKKAYILEGNLEVEIDLEDIKEGDIIVSRSKEKIPVDGIVIDGSAEIDESIINGRSEPQLKTKDDKVFANTLVQKGRILIKVNATGNNTYIARVMSKVEESLNNKSPGVLAAEKLASKVLKAGSLLTLLTFGFTGSILRAFSVMIVMSCPCSTILAASSAISAGISRGAREGILIKGGASLEKVSQSEVFCFDKTGTLTTGEPLVKDIILFEGTTELELFKMATLAEYRNTHPIATAINDYAKKLNIKIEKQLVSEILPGLGAKTKFNRKEILVGNAKLLEQNKVSTNKYKTKITNSLNKGQTIVFVAFDKKVLGIISFEHNVREGTQKMLNELKERGVKHLVLLTGDDEKVANNFSKQYGFDEVYSNLMPEDKANIIDCLRNKYKKVVMIGDGINDTLAMSKADVSISFASGGSEAAIEVSNIAITNSKPDDIIKLFDLSKKSLQTINQNYWIGTSTNIIGVGLAGLGILSPVAAGAIHIVHTVGIIANSSRITFNK